MKVKNTPLVLLILDGWGVGDADPYNAIACASTPNWDHWMKTYPHGLLEASGEAVGLPAGQIGNSEVGHLHIGAGRLVMQDLTRIQQAIASGAWAKNPVLTSLIQSSTPGQTIHMMGLFSDGGVHSHEDHLFAFLALCAQQGFQGRVALHLFLDGRDTPPQHAKAALLKLQKYLDGYPFARIASLCGRYDAMDRDGRWDRIQRAYDLLTQGISERTFDDPITALNAYYAEHCYDEFIPPTVIGAPCCMQDGDSLFFFNFRPDRARQLTTALLSSDFTSFQRHKRILFQQAVTMTAYQDPSLAAVVFPRLSLHDSLGEVLAAHGLKQLRIAETEKYAHVTFFLNGGNEALYPGEDRLLIPSPKVATYDLQPEMSAKRLTEKLVELIQKAQYDVIICNFANADMVGHTGIMQAAVEAITCLDACMATVVDAVQAAGGVLVITADHGNAEVMFDDKTNQPHTAHTTHQVPFLFIGEGYTYRGGVGALVDIAPTMLYLLGLQKPTVMTGCSLLL